MAKEEKLLTVQTKMKDSDFDDVYRIYLNNERGSDRMIGVVTCIVLGVICVLLCILLKRMTFLFYTLGCLLAGVAFYFTPANKKFIATNRLQFGEWREITFYPHSLTVMEIFEKDETGKMDPDELADAVTSISTGSLAAYENARGFLFAENKIVNQFVYVAKRDLNRQEIAAIRKFAEENCSGGYHQLETASIVDGEEPPVPEDDENASSVTADLCGRYYGAKQLRLYDEKGQRVDPDGRPVYGEDEETDAADDAQQEAHTETMDVPEIDIEEASEDIIAEETEEAEDGE